VGGIMELAPGYLPAVYKMIRNAGGLCISDEVQAGFGRTGSGFWGFESHGVIPDIVTMAKVIFVKLYYSCYFLLYYINVHTIPYISGLSFYRELGMEYH
jgi:4-aminobutyrate aminotransferase-like enzyme